jgi:hypothetical protein
LNMKISFQICILALLLSAAYAQNWNIAYTWTYSAVFASQPTYTGVLCTFNNPTITIAASGSGFSLPLVYGINCGTGTFAQTGTQTVTTGAFSGLTASGAGGPGSTTYVVFWPHNNTLFIMPTNSVWMFTVATTLATSTSSYQINGKYQLASSWMAPSSTTMCLPLGSVLKVSQPSTMSNATFNFFWSNTTACLGYFPNVTSTYTYQAPVLGGGLIFPLVSVVYFNVNATLGVFFNGGAQYYTQLTASTSAISGPSGLLLSASGTWTFYNSFPSQPGSTATCCQPSSQNLVIAATVGGPGLSFSLAYGSSTACGTLSGVSSAIQTGPFNGNIAFAQGGGQGTFIVIVYWPHNNTLFIMPGACVWQYTMTSSLPTNTNTYMLNGTYTLQNSFSMYGAASTSCCFPVANTFTVIQNSTTSSATFNLQWATSNAWCQLAFNGAPNSQLTSPTLGGGFLWQGIAAVYFSSNQSIGLFFDSCSEYYSYTPPAGAPVPTSSAPPGFNIVGTWNFQNAFPAQPGSTASCCLPAAASQTITITASATAFTTSLAFTSSSTCGLVSGQTLNTNIGGFQGGLTSLGVSGSLYAYFVYWPHNQTLFVMPGVCVWQYTNSNTRATNKTSYNLAGNYFLTSSWSPYGTNSCCYPNLNKLNVVQSTSTSNASVNIQWGSSTMCSSAFGSQTVLNLTGSTLGGGFIWQGGNMSGVYFSNNATIALFFGGCAEYFTGSPILSVYLPTAVMALIAVLLH